jgi:pimeloyl-ACP methyl ester carboxylesterase
MPPGPAHVKDGSMYSPSSSPRRGTRAFIAIAVLSLLLGPSVPSAIAQAIIIDGQAGDGSSYGLAMPAAWNGGLVVYAHGIVDPGAPLALPTTQDGFTALRGLWLDRGYAVAYSSFSENGYSLKSAIQRTHQLRGLFTARFGSADRTYLAGHSLGGLAIVALAEKYPTQYDGALPMCTPIGGGTAEIQYLGDARVAFDYFFPGVLPGGPFSVPPDTPFTPGSPVFTSALNAIVGGLFAADQRTMQFARVARLPFRNVSELISSAMSVVGFSIRFSNDVVEHSHGHIPYDNIDTIFTGSDNDVALNLGIERFEGARDAVNYFEKYFSPDGSVQIPMLTLHTRWDPVAPFVQEAGYAKKVADAGGSTWLTQRSITSYGHCNINAAETMSGFDALVAWVNGGAKPAGGDGTIGR